MSLSDWLSNIYIIFDNDSLSVTGPFCSMMDVLCYKYGTPRGVAWAQCYLHTFYYNYQRSTLWHCLEGQTLSKLRFRNCVTLGLVIG